MFSAIVTAINLILNNYLFLLIISSISMLLKVTILYIFVSSLVSRVASIKRRLYLSLILISAIFEDAAWVLVLSYKFFFVDAIALNVHLPVFIVRSAWIFYIIQYQSLTLLIENLSDQEESIATRQKWFIGINILLSIVFLITIINNFYNFEPTYLQLRLEEIISAFMLFVLTPLSILAVMKKLRNNKTPLLLKKQLQILITFFILPRMLLDLFQYYPFSFVAGQFSSPFSFPALSSLFLTFVLYYCARKVIGLRFLNFQDHVQAPKRYNFIDGFKDILEELSRATSIKELSHITNTFFKEAFNVPHSKTLLYVRAINHEESSSNQKELSRIETLTELFLANKEPALWQCINKVKILIYDEIDFNNFYNPNYADTTIIHFMDTINADIFLPIYKNQSIIGYVIVERHARLHEFYSHIERDEMLVYASYVGNIINLLQHRNLNALIAQEKELKEELYKKHQEINQYKESIRSFLKNNKHKDIGILFYKQRNFIFGNQAAKEMVKININTQVGHPLSKALRSIAQQVEEFKSPQSCITKDNDGQKIVIAGVPNLERNNVIITIYHPDFADIIALQLDHLKDPTKWDYLLYLETTKPGQLINQLIPGSGETLLNFKISLLKLALSKKALLLEMADEDIIPTVELLHHISMREALQMITLQGPSSNYDMAMKIFGINPIYGIQNPQKPLLEKLDGNGTLFIKNIEFLDRETQEYLAEFIRYGYFRMFKSDQKLSANVRIICSTNQNLANMVQEGTFSSALFNELKKASINMPSLLTLPETELNDLAEGYAEQTMKTDDFKNLLELSDKDKNRIMHNRPASLAELKNKVQQLLIQKSKKSNIDHEVQLQPTYDISDPDLIQAARLGKHALRDKRIMVALWNKFQNQNKIASFLGVNRSSVNRRCKEFHL